MVGLLIYVLIIVLVFGAISYFIPKMALTEPFRSAAYVILLILFIVILLGIIGIIPGFAPLGPRVVL